MIYIVEDDTNIREIESFALKNSGYEIEGFSCAKDFYRRCEVRRPELIVLDVMLPDDDGIHMVEHIRKSSAMKKIPIILVTAKTSEIDKVKGLDCGADDYLTKPFGVMELISRVKALLRRSGQEQRAELIGRGEIVMDDEKRSVHVEGAVCDLTYKEYELLKVFLQNPGIVLTREVLMDRVWGTDFEGESRTLDMHIKTLRQKLKTQGAMIRTVRNVGYSME